MKARRMIISAVLTIVMAMVGAGAATARALPARIQFKPGATAAVINGRVGGSGAASYVFRARAGQVAHVTFEAPRRASWTLVAPNGEPLKTTMSEARDASIKLWATGDYDLTVVSPSPAAFRLRLEIPPAQPSTSRVQRIHFPRGGTSATVTGIAGKGVHTRYVFRARAGQVARVRIASPSGEANWALTGPDGQPLKRIASEARHAVVELPATGDYRLAIGAPRSGTAYRLTLQIPLR
jgi:regulator of extracellular matrix RemA (YlzA/DUF370 family)